MGIALRYVASIVKIYKLVLRFYISKNNYGIRIMAGKRVFITGASRGIGEALAIEYTKKGDRVFITARSEKELIKITDEINNMGGEAYYNVCDVTSSSDMKKAVEMAYDKMTGIDLAILNAGINGKNSFAGEGYDEIRNIFNVNTIGIINGFEHLVPIMKKQGKGTIAGVSSIADVRGFPGSGAYCASKAAASHLLEAARIDLLNDNIKVINIRPGFIKTRIIEKNDFWMPIILEVDYAAKRIVDEIEKGKSRITFPYILSFPAFLSKLIPGVIFDYSSALWNKKMRGRK